jgi:DNA topoisomerase IA
VYEFVCRNFIGSLHQDLEFTRSVVTCQIAGSKANDEFELELVSVDNVGYAAAMPWVLRDIGATSNRIESDMLKEGDLLRVTKANVSNLQQKPPKFLQEYELIREMDSKGIGTGKVTDKCTYIQVGLLTSINSFLAFLCRCINGSACVQHRRKRVCSDV